MKVYNYSHCHHKYCLDANFVVNELNYFSYFNTYKRLKSLIHFNSREVLQNFHFLMEHVAV